MGFVLGLGSAIHRYARIVLSMYEIHKSCERYVFYVVHNVKWKKRARTQIPGGQLILATDDHYKTLNTIKNLRKQIWICT